MPNQRTAACGRYLREQPLFADLSPEDMSALSEIALIQEAPAGRRLWHQGDPGDRFLLVLKGQLEATRVNSEGHLESLGRLLPGGAAGETSLFLGDPHDATVTAMGPSLLLLIHRRDFQDLLHRRPSMGRDLLPREDICRALEAPRFNWQAEDERVVLYQRRHPWVLWRRLTWPFLCALLLPPTLHLLGLPLLYSVPGLAVMIAWVLWLWLEWRNDLLTVTTHRLVHVEKQLLVYERQEQAALDKIQDVSVVRTGPAAAVLGFGHLTVQTAGATGQITFTHIPAPEAVKEAIFEEMERHRALRRAARRQSIEGDLRRQLGLTTGRRPDELPDERSTLPQPESLADSAALHLTRIISNGFPRLRHQQGEVVLWRKHWVVLLNDLLWPLVALAVVMGLPLATEIRPPLIALAVVGALILAWLWWQWENWRNDVYILTPERIVDIKRVPLRLRTEQREGNLQNIQNVTFVVPGLFAGLLNYGHVVVETAGQTGNFTFEYVFAPDEVQADIFRYVEAARERRQESEESEQRQALADILAAYERLRNEMESPGGG